VNVSSFAVYSNLDLKRGTLLDESCRLEKVHTIDLTPTALASSNRRNSSENMAVGLNCLM
jgi:hypothetical protein